jgi:hypothetical protein
MKASKNYNNVIGEERSAHIRTIVVCLGGRLTYFSFMQLRNCVDEGILWFLVYWPYFVIDDFIFLFVALIELLELWMASFVVYEDFGSLCLACRAWGGCESAGPLGAWVDTQVLDPLRACVKVADCCDTYSMGTLTCVKMIETCVESIFATICVRFAIADHFFCISEDDYVKFALHQVTFNTCS